MWGENEFAISMGDRRAHSIAFAATNKHDLSRIANHVIDADVPDKQSPVRQTNLVLCGKGLLAGSNNPKLRTRLEIGKQKHESKQSELRCTAAEFRVSSGRVDCLRVNSRSSGPAVCEIIEIKPNNDKAVNAGWDQVKRYKDNILAVVRSGDFSGDNAVLKPCVDETSKEIMLEMNVVTYDFCPIPPEEIDVAPEEDQ